MKDRIALNMINQAEEDGLLKPGGTIIESSSGNTAIGLAIIAAVRGYKFIAIVDHHAAKEKLDIIRAYGGEVVFVIGEYAKGKAVVAEGLKAKYPKIKIMAVEPIGSTIFNPCGGPYLQSGTGNPVGADIPKNVNFDLIDDHCYVSDQEAFNSARFFARKKGILIGGSAGGVLYKAVEYAVKAPGSGKIVAITADGGEKYISTIFNDQWMQENELFNAKVVSNLELVAIKAAEELSKETKKELKIIVEKIAKTLDIRGYAKVDFRVKLNGEIYILEVNGQVSFHPKGEFMVSADSEGYTMSHIVHRIVEYANQKEYPKVR